MSHLQKYPKYNYCYLTFNFINTLLVLFNSKNRNFNKTFDTRCILKKNDN